MKNPEIIKTMEDITDNAVSREEFTSQTQRKISSIESLLDLDLATGGGGVVHVAKIPLSTKSDVSKKAELPKLVLGEAPPLQAVGASFVFVSGKDSKKAVGLSCMRLDLYPAGMQTSDIKKVTCEGSDYEKLTECFEKEGVGSLSIQDAVDGLIKSHVQQMSIPQFPKEKLTPAVFNDILVERGDLVYGAIEALSPLASTSLKKELKDPEASWNRPAPYELSGSGKVMSTKKPKVLEQEPAMS